MHDSGDLEEWYSIVTVANDGNCFDGSFSSVNLRFCSSNSTRLTSVASFISFHRHLGQELFRDRRMVILTDDIYKLKLRRKICDIIVNV